MIIMIIIRILHFQKTNNVLVVMVMADIFSCFRSNFILHLSTEQELKCLQEKLINVGTSVLNIWH